MSRPSRRRDIFNAAAARATWVSHSDLKSHINNMNTTLDGLEKLNNPSLPTVTNGLEKFLAIGVSAMRSFGAISATHTRRLPPNFGGEVFMVLNEERNQQDSLSTARLPLPEEIALMRKGMDEDISGKPRDEALLGICKVTAIALRACEHHKP